MVKETAKKSQLGSELAIGSLKDFIFSWPEYFSPFLQKTAFSLVNSRLSLVSPGCSFVTRPKLPRTHENGCWLHLSDQSHRKSAFSRPDQTRSDQQYKRNDLLSQTWEFSSSSQKSFFCDQIRCEAILSQIHTTREACVCKRYDKYRVIFLTGPPWICYVLAGK